MGLSRGLVIRLDRADLDALHDLCRAHGGTVSGVVRALIADLLMDRGRGSSEIFQDLADLQWTRKRWRFGPGFCEKCPKKEALQRIREALEQCQGTEAAADTLLRILGALARERDADADPARDNQPTWGGPRA